jgi:hypothetical protein
MRGKQQYDKKIRDKRKYLLYAFPAVEPAPLAAVAAVGLLDDIGIMTLLTDRAITFHPKGLGFFFHGE